MNVVIVYDIKSDRLRTKLAKELFLYGIRTQYSVFEADVNKFELKKLYKIVERYSIDDDRVAIYEIHSDIKRFGKAQYIDEYDLIL
jgi:CRISPR-associated endonuclease Cas2